MKKSQLRKIIRESIRSIVKEQSAGGAKKCRIAPCNNSMAPALVRNMTIDGMTPQAGDTFTVNFNSLVYHVRYCWAPSGGVNNYSAYTGTTCCRKVCGTHTNQWHPNMLNIWAGSSGNPQYIPGPQGMNGMCGTGMGPNCCGPNMNGPLALNPNATWSGGGTNTIPSWPGTTSHVCDQGGTPPPPPPTSGCQPTNAFPPNFNLQNWTNTWTSLPNFSSSNPNQPCNFVCQRRNQWTSQLAAGGMGPLQTNQVACKLAEAENQYQIHNCATSNANNCP